MGFPDRSVSDLLSLMSSLSSKTGNDLIVPNPNPKDSPTEIALAN